MDKQIFASHLGFRTWHDLITSSECVAMDGHRRWYVANTATWYKWVLWNTNFDLFFDHQTRNDALSTMKWYFKEHNIEEFEWCASEDYEEVHACLLGSFHSSHHWM